ncbi:MAG: hypothetical protein HKM06_00305 [Spirochaetales bacterium]|nr:hypothetical protein [Spirochaetales bacterium]
MKTVLGNADWTREISRQYSLTEDLVLRLKEEFLAATDLTVQEYVTQRHLELQASGWSNDQIFFALQKEVAEGRFRHPGATQRQIRRWIYG